MKIYCMRHGQTNYNLLGLCNDDPSDAVHLTEHGIAQAAHAAERLKDAPVARIFTSALPRTRQTAAIVNRHHRVAVVPDPRINDIRSGYNGRPVREYQQAIAHDPLHASVTGGESLLAHKRRVIEFLDWLCTEPDEVLLVVAHEETLRVCAAFFRGLSNEAMLGLTFANGEILEFEC